MNRAPAGSTLIELMIALSILAIIASVATLEARRLDVPSADDPPAMLHDSLLESTATGTTKHIRLVVNGHPINATANPDGSAMADSEFSVVRLTGTRADAR